MALAPGQSPMNAEQMLQNIVNLRNQGLGQNMDSLPPEIRLAQMAAGLQGGPSGIMPGEGGMGSPGTTPGWADPGNWPSFDAGSVGPDSNSLGHIYYEPHISFNGFYSESELEGVAMASRDMFEMGMHGYELYNQEVDRTLDNIQKYSDSLLASMPAIRNDLLKTQSVVAEQARANLDRNLSNQASSLATLSGGPAALMVAQMNKEANRMNLEAANSSQIQRLDEDQKRRQMYYDVVNDRLGHIGQAQTTMSNLINQWGANDVNMVQAGLQGQVNTVRNLVAMRMQRSQHQLDRDKLQVSWNQSLLNSQTSVYRTQLDFMSQKFNTMTTARAQMYDSFTRARANVYRAETEYNSRIDHAMIGATAGLYESALNNTAKDNLARLQLGASLYNTNANLLQSAWRNMTLNQVALTSRGINTIDNVSGQVNSALSRVLNTAALKKAIYNQERRRTDAVHGRDTEELRQGFEDTVRGTQRIE